AGVPLDTQGGALALAVAVGAVGACGSADRRVVLTLQIALDVVVLDVVARGGVVVELEATGNEAAAAGALRAAERKAVASDVPRTSRQRVVNLDVAVHHRVAHVVEPGADGIAGAGDVRRLEVAADGGPAAAPEPRRAVGLHVAEDGRTREVTPFPGGDRQ